MTEKTWGQATASTPHRLDIQDHLPISLGLDLGAEGSHSRTLEDKRQGLARGSPTTLPQSNEGVRW